MSSQPIKVPSAITKGKRFYFNSKYTKMYVDYLVIIIKVKFTVMIRATFFSLGN